MNDNLEQEVPAALTLEEYCRQSVRTAYVASTQDMLAHGALGLMTEVGEIFEPLLENPDHSRFTEEIKAYLVKEVGDAIWFLNYIVWTAKGLDETLNLSSIIPARFGFQVAPSFVKSAAELLVAAANLGSLIKSAVFYNKSFEPAKLDELCVLVLERLWALCVLLEVSPFVVLQGNLDKLRARYPEKFSTADALARKDETPLVWASNLKP